MYVIASIKRAHTHIHLPTGTHTHLHTHTYLQAQRFSLFLLFINLPGGLVIKHSPIHSYTLIHTSTHTGLRSRQADRQTGRQAGESEKHLFHVVIIIFGVCSKSQHKFVFLKSFGILPPPNYCLVIDPGGIVGAALRLNDLSLSLSLSLSLFLGTPAPASAHGTCLFSTF